jgi:hypothetical protein
MRFVLVKIFSRMRILPAILILTALLFGGCASRPEQADPVVIQSEAMTYLESGLRPEVLLFPEYLLMEGYELHQHGRIPETPWIGGGMKTGFSLKTVRSQIGDLLAAMGWSIDKVEMGRQSFRLMSTKLDRTLEIRAVQGSGPTQIFILYNPGFWNPQETATEY